jgi:hypothetical protein
MTGALLLTARGTASGADAKTVRVLPFDVPPATSALSLRFDFRPRSVTSRDHNAPLVEAAIQASLGDREGADRARRAAQLRELAKPWLDRIPNYVNAVLVDPRGRWRGRWEETPPGDGRVWLGREQASLGCAPGAIEPGAWQVALEVHGVFSEPVTWDLEVTGHPAVPHGLREPCPGPSHAARQRGPGWRFGELHAHSIHSDGHHDVTTLAERARSLGLDFVCLTDHNTAAGVSEGVGQPVTIVPGCEITTFQGHHPVYGVDEAVPWHRDGRVLGLAEMAAAVHGRGGVVSLAHPFRVDAPVCTGCRMPPGLEPAYDLLEVWYKRWDGPDADNQAAHRLWNELWRRGRRVTAVAARDWHGPSVEEPFPGALPLTGVMVDGDRPDDIIAGLRRGEVILSGGPVARIALEAVGQLARAGGSLRAARARLSVELTRIEPASELRVFASGELQRSLPLAGDGRVELDDVATGPGWYRVEVWAGDRPRVITNHVVLDR